MRFRAETLTVQQLGQPARGDGRPALLAQPPAQGGGSQQLAEHGEVLRALAWRPAHRVGQHIDPVLLQGPGWI
ncbi:hypothetical protein U9R90_00355 [Streptomyces sp. E11-3]|uniref:hypothetical protein n=1 Tax=Streptomyces sp. E11-3 TaxID=3110112 RepID=UPI0039806F3A